jgi:hypothetical protein
MCKGMAHDHVPLFGFLQAWIRSLWNGECSQLPEGGIQGPDAGVIARVDALIAAFNKTIADVEPAVEKCREAGRALTDAWPANPSIVPPSVDDSLHDIFCLIFSLLARHDVDSTSAGLKIMHEFVECKFALANVKSRLRKPIRGLEEAIGEIVPVRLRRLYGIAAPTPTGEQREAYSLTWSHGIPTLIARLFKVLGTEETKQDTLQTIVDEALANRPTLPLSALLGALFRVTHPDQNLTVNTDAAQEEQWQKLVHGYITSETRTNDTRTNLSEASCVRLSPTRQYALDEIDLGLDRKPTTDAVRQATHTFLGAVCMAVEAEHVLYEFIIEQVANAREPAGGREVANSEDAEGSPKRKRKATDRPTPQVEQLIPVVSESLPVAKQHKSGL